MNLPESLAKLARYIRTFQPLYMWTIFHSGLWFAAQRSTIIFAETTADYNRKPQFKTSLVLSVADPWTIGALITMTPATGKRSYRACLRCRQRKTRCNLWDPSPPNYMWSRPYSQLFSDGIGEPKKPPCVSCYQSGNECILSTKSRRGGNFRQFRGGPETEPAESTYISCQQREESPDEEECVERGDSSDVLSMDLRNPSDALHILALSGDQPQGRQSTSIPNEPVDPNPEMQDGSSAPSSCQPQQSHYHSQTTASIFNDYELVQRGLLRPSVVAELLFKSVVNFFSCGWHKLTSLRYSRYYHPYCPIAPSHLLSSSWTAEIQKSDYFLLTAILTIASRDDPHHSLIHRYCWDHTQRLLVDVLLAHPWTQTPRTVEGLLILAEWLPHIQTQDEAFDGPKNLFSEDRTTWSLIGLAVRQGYLQRLDQGAFPNKGSGQSKERVEQNRLVWACKSPCIISNPGSYNDVSRYFHGRQAGVSPARPVLLVSRPLARSEIHSAGLSNSPATQRK